MKKTLLAILATVAMVACSNDEIVREAAPEAIGFDNAFVNNSTRSVDDPSFTSEEGGKMFNSFRVYGFVEDAPLFKGTEVTGSGFGENGNWTYTDTQYWIAGANYDFHAVAPTTTNMSNVAYSAANGVTFDYNNVSGEEDMLYAFAEATGLVSGNEAVEFDFRHILSKVKFSFENGYNATNATLKVKNVVITDADATAKVNLNNTVVNWTDNGGSVNIAFGDATDPEATYDNANAYTTVYESNNERFLIPSVSRDYNVSFVVDLYISGQLIDVNADDDETGYEHTATVTFAPQAGHSYDIKATINAENIDPANEQEEIVFTVKDLNDWDTLVESVEGGNDDGDDVVIG